MQNELFRDGRPAGANSEFIHAVLPYARPAECLRGQELIVTGEQAECFYFVEEGSLEVSYTSQKTDIVVAIIGAGNFFGEIGFFDRRPRTRTIRATKDASLRIFNHETMAHIHAENTQLYTEFMEFLLRSVCIRFRQILSDRGPLSAYAAFLSTGKEHFQGLQPLPPDLLGSSGWQRVSRIVEETKSGLFDIAYRLQKDPEAEITPGLIAEGEAVLDRFSGQLPNLVQDNLPPRHTDLIWGYVFKEVFPYFMRSRFAERAYYKPKGYAGDFMMMEWIYRQEPAGDGKIGQLIDGWLLKQGASQAVRNRRRLLQKLLGKLCQQRLQEKKPVRIMNLACGPSRELFDLLNQCDYSENIDALCIDIDPEALQYANQHVNTFSHQASVRFMRENVVKWALGRAKHDIGAQDVIYSSGLCDYLDRRLLLTLIRRCYDQLAPGGNLIIGNFAPTNPDRLFMDHIVYWRLIYRDTRELLDVFAESPFGHRVEVTAEKQGVNLFAVATKEQI